MERKSHAVEISSASACRTLKWRLTTWPSEMTAMLNSRMPKTRTQGQNKNKIIAAVGGCSSSMAADSYFQYQRWELLVFVYPIWCVMTLQINNDESAAPTPVFPSAPAESDKKNKVVCVCAERTKNFQPGMCACAATMASVMRIDFVVSAAVCVDYRASPSLHTDAMAEELK